MSFTLSLGARVYAEGALEKIQGDPGLGFFRLTFPLKLHIHGAGASQGADLVNVLADVTMVFPGGARRLGWIRAHAIHLPIRNTEYSFSQTIPLEMQLHREQLEALEDHRGGGNFSFQFIYWFTLNDANNTYHLVQSNETVEINKGVWIALLDQIAYTKLALLEVPIFEHRVSPDLAEASVHLQKAQDAMLRGEYREAVGSCRDVLESIGRALRDKDEPSTKPQREWSKAERLQRVRLALKGFTHPARHVDEVTASFDWTRIDAASTITMCAALLQELGAPGARP